MYNYHIWTFKILLVTSLKYKFSVGTSEFFSYQNFHSCQPCQRSVNYCSIKTFPFSCSYYYLAWKENQKYFVAIILLDPLLCLYSCHQAIRNSPNPRPVAVQTHLDQFGSNESLDSKTLSSSQGRQARIL